MRIIGMSDVELFCSTRPEARAPLDALLAIVHRAEWRNTVEAQHQFGEIAHIDGPNQVRLDLPEHGVRIEMTTNFPDGSVRLKLTPRPKRA